MTIPSRIERTHGRFAVAFGVDHVTGPFCQVWLAPIDSQEAALIIVDNQGVRSEGWERECPASHQAVERWLRETRSRSDAARRIGNPYPNIDHQTVTRLFLLLGFPEEIGREVWEAFD